MVGLGASLGKYWRVTSYLKEMIACTAATIFWSLPSKINTLGFQKLLFKFYTTYQKSTKLLRDLRIFTEESDLVNQPARRVTGPKWAATKIALKSYGKYIAYFKERPKGHSEVWGFLKKWTVARIVLNKLFNGSIIAPSHHKRFKMKILQKRSMITHINNYIDDCTLFAISIDEQDFSQISWVKSYVSG